jgi:peptidoglycan/xylan/chitin deacetylase (PgdA/CDA1 family)
MLKSAVRSVFARPLFVRGARHVLRADRPCIFTLHRFASPFGDPGGCPEAELSRALAFLQRSGCTFISLHDLIQMMRAGELLPKFAVAFSVDDGYFDFVDVGVPVFSHYNCPVTLFVVTGFLDGKIWLWWDKLEYIFSMTKKSSVYVEAVDWTRPLSWKTAQERRLVLHRIRSALKQVPDQTKHQVIRKVAEYLAVNLPERCPDRYRPISWDQAKACDRCGVEFGPHTVTHPILSRVSDTQALYEISESWARVRAECGKPVPILAYPNGDASSFGKRECEISASAGLLSCLTTFSTHPDPAMIRKSEKARYCIPRFNYNSELHQIGQVISGFDQYKQKLRANVLQRDN